MEKKNYGDNDNNIVVTNNMERKVNQYIYNVPNVTTIKITQNVIGLSTDSNEITLLLNYR